MANTQSQFGFQHVGYISGAAPDYQVASRLIQSSFSTKIYFGDPVVKSASTGYVTLPANNTVAPVDGIFYGCYYVPSGGGAPVYSAWWPGSQGSDATAVIINAPGALFKVAALLTAIPPSAIGENIGWSTGAGGTTTGGGFSTFVADQSTLTTSAAWPFQVVDMFQGIGNGSDTTTNYNWVIVTFNNQRFKSLTGVA